MTSFLSFPDHPGFHYSPDGDKKDSPQTKEGPTPRRGRRKGKKLKKFIVFLKKMTDLTRLNFKNSSIIHLLDFPEPLSKLLKNAKQNAANTDGEKVRDTQR